MSLASTLQIDTIETARLTQSWILPEKGLGVLRIILLLIDIWVMGLTTQFNTWANFFIYATNWSGVLNLWYLALSTIVTWRHIAGKDSRTDQKVAYISQEMAIPIALMVVVLYWTTVNSQGTFPSPLGAVLSIQNHAGSCGLVLIDFFFNEVKFVPVHLVLTGIFFVAYLPVNAAWALTIAPVYGTMTWRSWWTAFFIALAFVAISFFYLILWALSKLKSKTVKSELPVHDLKMMAIQHEKHAPQLV